MVWQLIRSHMLTIIYVVVLVASVALAPAVAHAEDGTVTIPPREESPVPNKNPLTPAQQAYFVNLDTAQEAESVAIEDNEAEAERPDGSRERAPAVGETLLFEGQPCLTFDDDVLWDGQVWTFRYAAWGLQAEENPALNRRARHITFDIEQYTGDGNSFKMGMDKPAHGLIVSPHFSAKAGQTVRVLMRYYIKVNVGENDSQKNGHHATLHVKPAGMGGPAVADYSPLPQPGYYKNKWSKIEDQLTMKQDGEFQVVLEGINGSAIDSQIYFDNVEIWIDGVAKTTCNVAD